MSPDRRTARDLFADPQRDVYTVSRLNREARAMLEAGFATVWVEGEISNLARPASGHMYFTLKDPRAQVRCAMFRQRNRSVGFALENGLSVLARGRVSVYEPRGDYQFIVESLEAAGEGALRLAFEQLKRRLAAEGLFDETGKTELPPLPGRIGVITSPSGAAVRDVLNVLSRRFPAVPVRIYPVPVQGETAAAKIAAAIALADRRADCDVLILTRGGGSLEDLWPFNEEIVARAIHACTVPLVSAVGHETDVTIADFVADLRAPTPSAAAEQVVPDRAEWLRSVRTLAGRLQSGVAGRLERARERGEWLRARLEQLHPGRRLSQQAQRLDELELRLNASTRHHLGRLQSQTAELTAHLSRLSPAANLGALKERNQGLAVRLQTAIRQNLGAARGRLAVASRGLQGVSPLATLERGYAIVSADTPGRPILTSADQVEKGERIRARLHRGQIIATVTRVESGNED